METKQERILETLKQRINQLEDELRITKGALSSALDQNEEAKKEMDLLRAEAHDVVGQWEKEATDVRKRLAASEAQIKKVTSTLHETASAKESLEKQVKSLEKISGEYSTSFRAQKEKIEELEQQNAGVLQELAKSRKEFSEAMQQSREYEELTTAMQRELLKAAESEKTYLHDIESLRASLSHRTGEVEALRAQKDEISLHAEKLLIRINELKAANDQLYAELEETHRQMTATQAEVKRQKVQLEDLHGQCAALQAERASKAAECDNLTKSVALLEKEVAERNATIEQHLETISDLQKDVQELQDTGIVQGKILDEFQVIKDALENELAAVTKTKEETETQFAAIKDIYSTTLVDANDYKAKMETKCTALTAELERSRSAMAEAQRLSDDRYDCAMDSIKQLGASLQKSQLREVLLLERNSRGEIELTEACEYMTGASEFAQSTFLHALQLERSLAKTSSEAINRAEENRGLSETVESLKAREAAAANDLSRLRKSCATLESALATSKHECKELGKKKTELENDNSWLKEQVAAMRSELGELDELLNANLNRMQEENEMHAARNQSLQSEIDRLRESEARNAQKLAEYEKHFAELEGEFVAQTKALDVAEGDLRAANEEIDGLQRAAALANSRAEEAEQELSEVKRSNALLTSQQSAMKEQIRGQDERQNIILADKRREIDSLRVKINQHVEKAEEYAAALECEKRDREELERTLSSTKENNAKLRAALEELKERCANDASSLTQLINERDELVRDRDVIVERYNRLHDAFRNVKRENNSKISDELRKMLDFSTQQETELQQLRRENVTLKKSVSMFVTSAQPKAEAIFMERLNLTEGPLRHPKKRSVAKENEPAS